MTQAAIITTQRLTLRKPVPEDWSAFRDFCLGARTDYIGGPFTLGSAWRHLAAMIGHWEMRGFGMMAVTETGQDRMIGMVGHYYPGDWPEREIGWLVFDRYEGQGIAHEAARAVVDHAFGALGWDTAVSYIDAGNTRSIALAERLGATRDVQAEASDPRDKPCVIYRHPRPETVQ